LIPDPDTAVILAAFSGSHHSRAATGGGTMPDDKPDYTLDGILKSILKSRGASKEKFSHKPPEIKITHPPLSPKENTIILDLEESVRSLKRYNWSNSCTAPGFLDTSYS
jgi:hypothetical protein